MPARVNERHRHRQPTVDVGLLYPDPTKILEPRQPDVLYDEIEIRKVRCRLIHVCDVERVPVQGPDGRALVDVNVFDPELHAFLQVLGGRGIRELPALGVTLPLGRIELDALEIVLVYQLLELPESLLSLARVEGAVEDELVRVLLLQDRVLFSGVEAVGEEFGQVGRLEDRNVNVARLEEIVHHILFRVLVVLLLRPDPLLWAQVLVVVVEAVDEPLAVLVAVLGAGIPVMDVPVYHEILLSIFLVQEISSPKQTTMPPLDLAASPLSSGLPHPSGVQYIRLYPSIKAQVCSKSVARHYKDVSNRLLSPNACLHFGIDSCRLPSRCTVDRFKAHTRYDILSARHKPT